MGLADASNETITKRTFKKPIRKKKKEEVQHKYVCEKCHDAKFVKTAEGKKIKCSCTVKLELKDWIDPRLQSAYRGKSLTLDLTKKEDDLTTVLFDGIKVRTFLQSAMKHLVENYFKNGSEVYPYYLMTGNDYTEKFVIGEANIYHTVKELYVVLGLDNYNKTLQTTIYSLIVERNLKNLTTWILVNDTRTSTASINDMYGTQLLDFIKTAENFDKIYRPKK